MAMKLRMSQEAAKEPVLQIGLKRDAWGPRFWKILHTLAEGSGRQANLLSSNDEADQWMIFLKAQAFVMPCTLCKKHYLQWYAAHRPDHLRSLIGEERRRWLRSWFWGCHDSVNEINQKGSPPLDTLSELYPLVSIEKEYREIIGMFQLAHNTQKLKPEDTQRWRSALARLRIFGRI
jgi:hypothetical protein